MASHSLKLVLSPSSMVFKQVSSLTCAAPRNTETAADDSAVFPSLPATMGWIVHGLQQAYCTLHAAIALMLRWY